MKTSISSKQATIRKVKARRRKNKGLSLKARSCSARPHSVSDCRLRIHSKSSGKLLRELSLRNRRSLRRFLRRISRFIENKMIQECVCPCISLGHRFWSMVSKDLKVESGAISIEDLFGFMLPPKSHHKRKLIILRIIVGNFTNKSVMTYLSSLKDILQAALSAEWT